MFLRKRILLYIIPFLLVSVTAGEVHGFEPYENYTYDYEINPWREPQAYIPDGTISGETLGISGFNDPSDVFVAGDGQIYIADTGNNRIIVLTDDYSLTGIIDQFENHGSMDHFNKPEGIFVTKEGHRYIADTENKRIVVLDSGNRLITIMEEPAFNVDSSLIYMPVKIAVDDAGRIFVISRHFNMGMIELDKSGQFTSFFGAITVTAGVVNRLWRRIATQQQRDKMIQNVPTEYSGNDVDEEGFVYGTIGTENSAQPIRKLNSLGIDVLRRMGAYPPRGDINASYDEDGWPVRTSLADICVGNFGIYSVLDSTRGRVFTYNNDGSLMYVFGAIGNRAGTLLQPKAIDQTASGEFLLVDGALDQIVRFKPTVYAAMINEAVEFQYHRDYDHAKQKWLQILQYTSKSELAYVEIGKVYYRNGEYATAMDYFKLGNDKVWYSNAYKKYRRIFLNRLFDAVLNTSIVILVVLMVSWIFYARKKRGRR